MNFEKITGKVYGKRNTEESFSYPYKNMRKMVCVCGYEGISVNETCKKCRQKTSVQINEPATKTPIYSELRQVKKEGDCIYATLIVRDAFKNLKQYYLLKTTTVSLKFNIKSGETFANGQNITYLRKESEPEEASNILQEVRERDFLNMVEGFPRRGVFDYMPVLPRRSCFETKPNQDVEDSVFSFYTNLNKCSRVLLNFFSLCAKERNIRYTNLQQLLTENDGIEKMIVLLRLPVLESAEELNIAILSKEIAEKLDVAKSGKDVWHLLVGHTGKEIKKFALKDVNHLNHVMRWGQFVEKQANLVKIANSFSFEGRSYSMLWLEPFKQTSKLFETFDEKQNNFRTGIQVLQSTHPNETVWVNRLLQFKKDKNEDEVYRYMCDIGEMYAQIKNAFPDFILRKTQSIKIIHDNLAAWIKKINVPELKLPFTDEMKVLEGNGFVFAKTTHELVEVGVEMDICVGSYWSRVHNGYCSIVFLKERNQVMVCLELNANLSIVQAKMYNNERPSKRYQEKIAQWAKKHNLNIQTYDLNFETRRMINPLEVRLEHLV